MIFLRSDEVNACFQKNTNKTKINHFAPEEHQKTPEKHQKNTRKAPKNTRKAPKKHQESTKKHQESTKKHQESTKKHQKSTKQAQTQAPSSAVRPSRGGRRFYEPLHYLDETTKVHVAEAIEKPFDDVFIYWFWALGPWVFFLLPLL